MYKTILTVNGMSCEHCAAEVKKAAESVAGVKKAKVDLKHGKADIECESEAQIPQVKVAISDAGYEAL
jgi:copper chaperone CopZ